MALDSNADRFSERVNATRISGNLDAPEGQSLSIKSVDDFTRLQANFGLFLFLGGFDGIMQAVVCGDHIGWRKHSRRLLLFSTDSSFHYAGDGKVFCLSN